MNIPKQAIEKAVERGWKPKLDIPEAEVTFVSVKGDISSFHYRHYWEDAVKDEGINDFSLHEIALDTTFWEALGKALNWNGQSWQMYLRPVSGREAILLPFGIATHVAYGTLFAYLVFTGGDVDKFWEEILK